MEVGADVQAEGEDEEDIGRLLANLEVVDIDACDTGAAFGAGADGTGAGQGYEGADALEVVHDVTVVHEDVADDGDGASHGDGTSHGDGAAEGSAGCLGQRKIVNEYLKVRGAQHVLGRGTRSSVKLYRNATDGRLYALKAMRRAVLARIKTYYTDSDGRMAVRTGLDQVQDEVALLSRVPPHPHVCRLLKVLDDARLPKLYLVFPYFGGGQLMTFDNASGAFLCSSGGGHGWSGHGIDRADALRFLRQIASALAHVHDAGVIHRDVKPGNVLLDAARRRAVLADFGVAKAVGGAPEGGTAGGRVKGTDGTYAFFAPEVCSGGGSYDGFAADVWALGVTLYAMLFGVPPFMSAQGPQQLFEKIAAAPEPVPPPCADDVAQNPRLGKRKDAIAANAADPALLELLAQLLCKDPSKRLRAAQVAALPILQL